MLDPIWTTAYITRNHGYMIFDTLFALDADLKLRPQMVDKWAVSRDAMKYSFTLRDGLKFHDGQAVTAEDCVTSIKRWGARDAVGRLMMAAVGKMAPVDKKTFTIDLEQPFGLVLDVHTILYAGMAVLIGSYGSATESRLRTTRLARSTKQTTQTSSG